MSTLALEGPTVQFPLVRHAVAAGWTFVSDEDALSRRGGENGLFFLPEIRAALLRLGRSRAEQDFVIVHELLHLRHPNHGPVFRALMRTHLSARRRQMAQRALRNGEPTRSLLSGEPRDPK